MAKATKKKAVQEETQALPPMSHYPMHMSCVEIRLLEKLTLIEKELHDIRMSQAYMAGQIDEISGALLEAVDEEEEETEEEEVDDGEEIEGK